MVSTQRRLVPRVAFGPDARILTLAVKSQVGIATRPTTSMVELYISKCGFETTLKPFCTYPESISFDLGNDRNLTETGLYKAIVLINECVLDHFEIERNANLQFMPMIIEDDCSGSNWKDECCTPEPTPTVYQACKTTGQLSCGCADLERGGCPACTGPQIIIARSRLMEGRFSEF